RFREAWKRRHCAGHALRRLYASPGSKIKVNSPAAGRGRQEKESTIMDYAKESLRLHGEWKGKIEVVSRVPVNSKEDLSLAYTPGVAQPCLEIQKDVNKSYELTRRHN